MNVDRFKNNGSGVYFEEVLEKIRDIRSSEKVFWRKILDLAIVITIFAIRRKIYNKIEKI